MDRRAFLTGVGTIGAASAAGWSALESQARGARAAALARAAGAMPLGAQKAASAAQSPLQHGLTLGYLPGSPGLLDYASRGQQWDGLAAQMRWATWHSSLQFPTYEDRVDVAIGRLRVAEVDFAPGMVRSVEVVAYFAVEDTLQVAPFPAWGYQAIGASKARRETSPLVFEAGMPDRVALQVNYAFDPATLAPGLASSGTIYMPLGARDGPGPGVYVLAAPSRVTGALPDLTEYRFSGDLNNTLVRRETGGTAEFDYIPLTIAPVTA